MGYIHYWDKPKNSIKDNDKLIEIRGHLDKIIKNSNIIQWEEDINQSPELYIDWCNNCVNIRFNGINEKGHETFIFDNRGDFNFCKTNRKPYDLVVCKCLLILNYFFDIDLKSDGFSSNYRDEYKLGSVLKKDDVDSNWFEALTTINKLLNINYQFIVDNIIDSKYMTYKLILK